MSDTKFAIRAVARRTGLKPDVIRAWERRYGAVAPARTVTGRRVYGEGDIERLRLLRAATNAGHSIGQIAVLSVAELNRLVEADETPATSTTARAPRNAVAPRHLAAPYLEKCLVAVEQLDAETLEDALTHAAIYLGPPAVIDDVMVPLMERIDQLWEDGMLRIAQEHLASAIIRVFLSSLMRHVHIESGAPVLLVTTPAGQLHEIGALMVAAIAAWQGWHVLYLGPNLPAAEIALAARHSKARAIALSIVYPARDPHIEDELKALKKHLPRAVAIVVGGRASDSYAGVLTEIGAARIHDMNSVRQKLEELRPRRAAAPRAARAKKEARA